MSNLARGRALLEGRNHITLDDISIVIKTAMDSAQIERVSLFNLLLAHGGTLTTTQIFQSLRIARKTALRTMAEFHVIGLVEMENFHEPGQNNVNKRMVLSPNLSWLLTDSVITKFFPQITSSFFQGDDNTISVFWSIYEGLENGNGNGDGRQGTVAHNELHEALVSSGKFYAGDATQIVEDMVKSGSLETVSFGTYKRVSGDH